MDLLDLVFPKRCVSCGAFGKYICNGCFSKIEFVEKPICPICQRQAIGGKTHPKCAGKFRLDGLAVACKYKGPIKFAIRKVKYKWVYDIETVLVDLLASQIWKFDLPQNSALVPVPLHPKRKNWRGFNQAEILAKTMAKKFGVKYSDLLARIIETKTQVGLTRDERKENVKGAFSLRPFRHPEPIRSETHGRRLNSGSRIRDKNIILVDDVYTSGATMMEAAKVLKRAGAKSVWAMAVAFG